MKRKDGSSSDIKRESRRRKIWMKEKISLLEKFQK